MATFSPPASRDGFQIAIICALQLEYDAATLNFDEFWDKQYGKAEGDQNTYTTGRIGDHQVVLILLSGMGKVSAASGAGSLYSSYTRLQLAILVGICGAVPKTPDGLEIVLGDVVIGEHIIQYDFGRQYPSLFITKDISPIKPNEAIRSFLGYLQTEHGMECLQADTIKILPQLQKNAVKKRRRTHYPCPKSTSDILFESTYIHKHRDQLDCGCSNTSACQTAIISSCEELQCDGDNHSITRRRLQPRQQHDHRIFFGGIGSADAVMKSGEHRDQIASDYGLIAFEMEGAGLCDRIPWIIVKGICDYADSHKNKIWQPFAAAMAASTTKALLGRYCPTDRPATSYSRSDSIYPDETVAQADQHIKDFIGKLYRMNPGHESQQAEINNPAPGPFSGSLEYLVLGKTVLAKFLSANFTSSSKDIVAAFYFKAGQAGREHANQALCTLLLQLWRDRTELVPRPVAEGFYGKGDELCSTVEDLWAILVQTSSTDLKQRIVCIIDGLDECSPSSREKLITCFNQTFHHNTSTGTDPNQLNLKVLVTSRPNSEIQRKFVEFEEIRLRTEDETDAVAKDIQTAIHYRVNQMRTAKDLHSDMCDRLEQHLSSVSGESFLLVHLIFERIEALWQKDNKSVVEVFEMAPNDVFTLYESEMKRFKDMKKTKKLFGIILAAKRPLSLDEINIAMYIEPTDKRLKNIGVPPSNVEVVVKDLGGILIRVVQSHVHLVHETAREYLLSEAETHKVMSSPDIRLNEGHRAMANACVYFLVCDDWRSLINIYKTAGVSFQNHHPQSPSYKKCRKNWAALALGVEKTYKYAADQELPGGGSFFQYASKNWFYHVDAMLERTECTAKDRSLQAAISCLCNIKDQIAAPWWYVHKDYSLTPTCFHFWASKGQLVVLEGILASRTLDINHSIDSESPLHTAVMCGHARETFWFIEQLDESTIPWDSILQRAFNWNRDSILAGLLQQAELCDGLKSTLQGEPSTAVLVDAIENSSLTIVKRLLDFGISFLNEKSFKAAAAHNSRASILDYLCTRASAVQSRAGLSSCFQAALREAAILGQHETFEIALRYCDMSPSNTELESGLLASVRRRDATSVKIFLNQGAVDTGIALLASVENLDQNLFQLLISKQTHSSESFNQALAKIVLTTHEILAAAAQVIILETRSTLAGSNIVNEDISCLEPMSKQGHHFMPSDSDKNGMAWYLETYNSKYAKSTKYRPWKIVDNELGTHSSQRTISRVNEVKISRFSFGRMSCDEASMRRDIPGFIEFLTTLLDSNDLRKEDVDDLCQRLRQQLPKNSLAIACLVGQKSLASLLIKLGFAVNDQTWKRSLAIASVISGNAEVVLLLQSHGADMTTRESFCLPYRHYDPNDPVTNWVLTSRENDFMNLYSIDMSFDQDICFRHIHLTGSPLAFATALGYDDIIQALQVDGMAIFPKQHDSQYLSVLEAVISKHSDEALTILKDGLPPVASQTLLGDLLSAAIVRSLALVSSRLMELEVTLKNHSHPRCLLNHACKQEDLILLQNLEKAGLDLFIRRPNGETLLHEVARRRNLDIFGWLLSLEKSRTLQEDERTSLARTVVLLENDSLMNILTSSLPLCLRDVDVLGRTILQYAVTTGRLSMAKLLITKGVSILHVDKTGCSVLNDMALSYDRPGVPQLFEDVLCKLHGNLPLGDHGFDFAEPLLRYAIRFEAIMLCILALSGFDINGTTKERDTLLHVAIRQADGVGDTPTQVRAVQVCKFLVKSGVDPKQQNVDGLSALEYCDKMMQQSSDSQVILGIRKYLGSLPMSAETDIQLRELEEDSGFWLEDGTLSFESSSEAGSFKRRKERNNEYSTKRLKQK